MKWDVFMDDSIDLPLPLEEPEPRPDCAKCTDLAVQREEARQAGDLSRVSDCNVRMRKHHRGRRQPRSS